MLAGEIEGRILASQLNPMCLFYFSVFPDRLSGLITLGERDFFKQAATRKDFAFRLLPPTHPVALKMNELSANRTQRGLSYRLAMLQLLVETAGDELNRASSGQENTDATQRLRLFLKQHPQDIILETSFNELAQMTCCTPRHLSRIFQEVVGMSFSDKRAEIRLGRARDLLATGESKVVEVAMESGYKSLSSFNLMFTRRFGISPGRWRKKNGAEAENISQQITKASRLGMGKARRMEMGQK